MRTGDIVSLTVMLPNDQTIDVPVAVVRWSRGQDFAAENTFMGAHTHVRLQHYVKNRKARRGQALNLSEVEPLGIRKARGSYAEPGHP